MGRKTPQRPAGGQSGAPRFVAYYRVSTAQQGSSGLGLEAQQAAVARHLAGAGGNLVGEFQEIESGKRNDRPQLAAALSHAQATGGTLIIAKLDRLARNLHFVTGLQEAGVDFLACDNPHATKLMVHMLVAFAEHEREQISTRTKAALAAAKARGVRLGNPRLKAGDRSSAIAAGVVRKRNARRKAEAIGPYIKAAEKAGCTTLEQKAEALTARGIKTPGGCSTWSAEQVRRVIKRTQP